MSLMARLQKQPAHKTSSAVPAQNEDQKKEDHYNELKSRVHYRLLDLLDLARLASADDSNYFRILNGALISFSVRKISPSAWRKRNVWPKISGMNS